MKTLKLLAIGAMAVFLASCGDGNSVTFDVELDPSSLDKYITLQDKKVTLEAKKEKETDENFLVTGSLTFKVEKPFTSERLEYKGLVLDKDKKKIIDFEGKFPKDRYKTRNKLGWEFPAGEVILPLSEVISAEEWEEVRSKAESFFLRAEITDDFKIEYTDISSNEVDSSSDSEDWDALLSDLEKYTDEIVACMKKVKDGDMEAMDEASSLTEKANKIGKKLENAKDKMSDSQWDKYMKIAEKMLDVAQ